MKKKETTIDIAGILDDMKAAQTRVKFSEQKVAEKQQDLKTWKDRLMQTEFMAQSLTPNP